ncbi:MAG: TonB-dependent receptor plug domain-containing protein [Brevundimonas sp.]|uniref:TonB-dependent receptor plug domain-containing protein n=1 Tax=Brevundimonas sp. TaxID=1871086 RepID=UPI00391A08BF
MSEETRDVSLKQSCCVAALAALIPHADVSAASAEERPVSVVDEVVVTATRSPRPAARIASSVSVIESETLERRQSPVLTDVLSFESGVQVTRNGGPGQVAALRLRGAESDQTLVVVDGIRLNDPSSVGAGYNFGHLLLADAGRIEVLRGPHSTLWGSHAIGGVVHIESREPRTAFEGSLDLETGSYSTHAGRARLAGRTGALSWRLGLGHYQSDSVSAFDQGVERDPFRQTSYGAGLSYEVSEALIVDLRAIGHSARTAYDGFPAPAFVFDDTREYAEQDERGLYGAVRMNTGPVSHRLAISHARTERISFDPDQAVTDRTFESRGTSRRFEYQGVADLGGDWRGVFGLERDEGRAVTASPSAFDPSPVPARNAVRLDSAYGLINGPLAEGLYLTLGVRRDEHETFGGQTLVQGGLSYALTPGTVIRASYGEGFKTPSLFQLYSDFGNPVLQPEEATSLEAGISHSAWSGRVRLDAVLWQRRTDNLIDFVFCPAAGPICPIGAFGVYDNVQRARAEGLELAGRIGLDDGWSLRLSYDWTRARNDTPASANRGNLLARRPQHQAALEIEHLFASGGDVGLGVRFVGASFDDAANTVRLASHTLVDLRASWPLGETLSLTARAENLFDADYRQVAGYGTPGRSVHAGLRLRF